MATLPFACDNDDWGPAPMTAAGHLSSAPTRYGRPTPTAQAHWPRAAGCR
jgi:hypothetical protein